VQALTRAAGAALLALGLSATAASAQVADWSQGWSGKVTLYAWLPAINGSQEGPDGEPLVDLDNWSVLEALDMAFMGAAEIRKDRWGLLFDAVYADLGTDGTWVQERVDTSLDTKLGFYTAAAFYRVHEADRSFVDVYGGARYFDTRASFDLRLPNQNVSNTVDAKLTWTDPIIGVRGGMPLTERWSVSGFADVGGFESGSDLSWEVYGGANYEFADRWAGTVGYRYISIEKEVSSRAALDINIQGPLLGITYKF
jgi:opacity protein-like surface antigen